MTALYTDGTITLVNGSPIITGTDTAWKVSNIVGGTVIAEVDGGSPLPILPNDGDAANLHPITDTQMTAAIKWTGPSGTYKYAIVRETSYNRQQAANAEKLGDLLSQLDAPLLAALSSVEGLQDHLILLTGPSTLSLIPRTSLVEGVKRDVTVNTLADLATYSGEAKDFTVLVANAGDGRAALFIKRSNADGDWVAPAYITGSKGNPGLDGEPGPYTTIQIGDTTTLAPGQPATVQVVPVSEGVIRLDFGLPKGHDGTGTGDVVGPSGSVNNRVAFFDGSTGKVLKDGGITLGNAASRNVGTSAGTVAAGDDARFSQAGSSQNEAILALEIADLKGSRLGMRGGIADAFDDESGVNVKTNATYDATNDWYTPVSGQAVDQTEKHTSATQNGNTVTASTQYDGNYPGWKAFNKSQIGDNAINTWATSSVATGWLQYQFSSAKTINSYSITSVAGENDRAPSGWTLLGSNTGAFNGEQVTLDTRSGQTNWVAGGEKRRFTIATPGSYTYYRLNVTGTNGEALLHIDEVTLDIVSAPQNMTLRSVAYSAASVPSAARIAVQLVETDAITINTDVVVKVSRDGGANGVPVTLSLSQSLVGPKMYEATKIDLTTLPSGTSMVWELQTANNKNVAVSGIVFHWS